MSCHQNAGQNHNLLIATTSFENVAKFKNMRTVTKIAFKKLRADYIWGMLATILFRIFYLCISSLKT
jgi:hypothetical protein